MADAEADPDPDPTPRARALAQTYEHPSYPDPWDARVDYRRVLDYQAAHPSAGRTRIGNALDLPPSRVRGWLNDKKPDVVHGIQTAERQGWLTTDPDSRVFRGLNVLVAWIFSGGSIRSPPYYVPQFTVHDPADEQLLNRAATAANTQLYDTREDTAGRGRERRPAEHASVLGRLLHALGAPVGPKTPDSEIGLPPYLTDASTVVRREFTAVYVHNRGQAHDGKATVTIREDRPAHYVRDLAAFMQAVADQPVRGNAGNVIVSAAAAREIESWPPILDRETPARTPQRSS